MDNLPAEETKSAKMEMTPLNEARKHHASRASVIIRGIGAKYSNSSNTRSIRSLQNPSPASRLSQLGMSNQIQQLSQTETIDELDELNDLRKEPLSSRSISSSRTSSKGKFFPNPEWEDLEIPEIVTRIWDLRRGRFCLGKTMENNDLLLEGRSDLVEIDAEDSQDEQEDDDEQGGKVTFDKIIHTPDLTCQERSTLCWECIKTTKGDPRSESWPAVLWTLLIGFILVYNLIEIPLRTFYDSDPEHGGFVDVFNLLTDLIFLTDVVIQFRTGYWEHGSFVHDDRKIAQKYLKSWFVLDFSTSLPLDHLLRAFGVGDDAGDFVRVTRYYRVFKVARMVKLFKMIRHYEGEQNWVGYFVRLFKMIVIVFLVGHLSASMLMISALVTRNSDGDFHPESWIVRHLGVVSFDEISLTRLYMFTLYWALQTIATVGYGDITPWLDEELFIFSLVIFIGTIAFGYILTNVGTFITQEGIGERILRLKLTRLKEFLKARLIPRKLQNQIRTHYEYSWQISTASYEKEITSDLPSALRVQLTLELHADFISQVEFLRELENDCVAMLLQRLRPLQLSPKQYIYREGSFGSSMYFIQEGEVEESRKQIKQRLFPGEYFGYFVMFGSSSKRYEDIRAITFVRLLEFPRSAMEEIMTIFPHFADRMKEACVQELQTLYHKFEVEREQFLETFGDVLEETMDVETTFFESDDEEEIINELRDVEQQEANATRRDPKSRRASATNIARARYKAARRATAGVKNDVTSSRRNSLAANQSEMPKYLLALDSARSHHSAVTTLDEENTDKFDIRALTPRHGTKESHVDTILRKGTHMIILPLGGIKQLVNAIEHYRPSDDIPLFHLNLAPQFVSQQHSLVLRSSNSKRTKDSEPSRPSLAHSQQHRGSHLSDIQQRASKRITLDKKHLGVLIENAKRSTLQRESSGLFDQLSVNLRQKEKEKEKEKDSIRPPPSPVNENSDFEDTFSLNPRTRLAGILSTKRRGRFDSDDDLDNSVSGTEKADSKSNHSDATSNTDNNNLHGSPQTPSLRPRANKRFTNKRGTRKTFDLTQVKMMNQKLQGEQFNELTVVRVANHDGPGKISSLLHQNPQSLSRLESDPTGQNDNDSNDLNHKSDNSNANDSFLSVISTPSRNLPIRSDGTSMDSYSPSNDRARLRQLRARRSGHGDTKKRKKNRATLPASFTWDVNSPASALRARLEHGRNTSDDIGTFTINASSGSAAASTSASASTSNAGVMDALALISQQIYSLTLHVSELQKQVDQVKSQSAGLDQSKKLLNDLNSQISLLASTTHASHFP